jgi:hypothetical protein
MARIPRRWLIGMIATRMDGFNTFQIGGILSTTRESMTFSLVKAELRQMFSIVVGCGFILLNAALGHFSVRSASAM